MDSPDINESSQDNVDTIPTQESAAEQKPESVEGGSAFSSEDLSTDPISQSTTSPIIKNT